ncbi:MAG: hypothetical protein UZ13_02601 [Chloroflexi bacterium OLB13]|nr:MAG: hypothetical protein UZ13_02601 [Chloroflexi bacterium OLB13]
MPTLSRYFIKTGMLYLIAGLAMTLAMFLQPLLGWSSVLQAFYPVYLHFIFVGWVTQIIMGVAYWMFPKKSKEDPRGNPLWGWAVYVCLNVGLLLRAVGEPTMAVNPASGWGWTLTLAAALMLAAGWIFVCISWNRVKER